MNEEKDQASDASKASATEQDSPPEGTGATEERFPELGELEEKIRKRLRSNQRFLERFMDENYDDLDDDDDDLGPDDDDPEIIEEL